MSSCQVVFTFLSAVAARNVSTKLPDEDLTMVQQLNLVQRVSKEDYAKMKSEVDALPSTQATLAQKEQSRAALAADLQRETNRSHSILFHLERKDKQAAELQKVDAERAALQAANAELSAGEQEFRVTIAKKSLFDTLTQYDDSYVGLTGFGRLLQRELSLRMYRYSDVPFSTYIEHSQKLDRDLTDVAARAAEYFATLWTSLASQERSYLWAISIGLAKRETDVAQGSRKFLETYGQLRGLSENAENRLMSAEMLSAVPRSIQDSLPVLTQLQAEVRKLGVPGASSLGVAALLLLGQRADGTLPTANLEAFLRETRSYESAGLLAIVNRPFAELSQKFAALHNMFNGWGYGTSEDVELASAYLAISELPVDGFGTKLAIITKGVANYLQYPLVASAILASVPVLEANETLNLLEQAYEIIGKRAMPMSQPELICLAVRMIHGIRPETVRGLDATATAPPAPALVTYPAGQPFFFVPAIITHGLYYSTFSGIGGAHPGHAHVWGGFVG